MSEFRATDPSAVDQLVEEVLSRLGATASWNQGGECRLVKVEEEAQRFRYIIECGADRLGMRASAEGEFDRELARRIDHTLLRANATGGEVRRLCEEALEYGFAAVCINPAWVRLARSILQGSSVSVCTVAGFPLGAGTSDIKAFEARRAVFDGANEVDMVINVGSLKDGDDNLVREDIRGVVKGCHENGAICKVIIEAAFLSDEEKVKACVLSKEAGADFVKTSTGFGPGGATAEDVALMRRVVGPSVGVKAAGGIKDSAGTKKMIEAGATRIGASAGVKIVKGEKSDGRY